MITSEITIKCTNKNQLTALGSFIWPAGVKLGRMIPVSTTQTKLENCFTEGGFEDEATGIAMHIAREYPGKPFQMEAELQNPDNYYIEKIAVQYDGYKLTVNLRIEDQMFKNEKKCLRCENSLETTFHEEGFVCPHCKAIYKPTDAGNPFDADYVFGSEEFTYGIPQEHI